MRYSQMRYARCALAYTFPYQWMLDEQSACTPQPCSSPIGTNNEWFHPAGRQRPDSKQPDHLGQWNVLTMGCPLGVKGPLATS